jgi:hypothetical protein
MMVLAKSEQKTARLNFQKGQDLDGAKGLYHIYPVACFRPGRLMMGYGG